MVVCLEEGKGVLGCKGEGVCVCGKSGGRRGMVHGSVIREGEGCVRVARVGKGVLMSWEDGKCVCQGCLRRERVGISEGSGG